MTHKKQAPSAHLSRFGKCTNGVQLGVGDQTQVSSVEVNLVAPNNAVASAHLLRNVNLLFFINVAEEINQATNKGNRCEAERDPS